MIIFKTYLKILNRYKLGIFITLFILIGSSILFSSWNSDVNENVLKNTDIAIIDKTRSQKSQGLTNYLAKTMKVVGIEDDEMKIKDALFYRTVRYVLIIKDDKYSSYTVPNAKSGYLVQNQINAYINTYNLYENAKVGYSAAEIATKVQEDLKKTIKVESILPTKIDNNATKMNYFFNFYVYGVLAVIFTGVCTVMVAFNKGSVLKRTIASNFSIRKRNAIIYLCHVGFALFVWLLSSIISIILYPGMAFNSVHWMYLLNSLALVLPGTALAFVISLSISNFNVIAGVNNVVTLSLSFISGTFIPQAYLGDFVLRIASFTPTYWYIVNNEKIKGLSSFQLDQIAQPILVQLAFTLGFVALALAISKQKENNF